MHHLWGEGIAPSTKQKQSTAQGYCPLTQALSSGLSTVHKEGYNDH